MLARLMTQTKDRAGLILRQQIRVAFDFPVVFTRDVFNAANPALVDAVTRLGDTEPHRIAFFVDASVAAAVPGLVDRIRAYADRHRGRLELAALPKVLAGGEAVKNSMPTVQGIVEDLVTLRLDRHACVIAIGGGAFLDAVGFAASLVHRGLRMVRIPTTVLAQNDAGVGVKTGVNFMGGKNMLGTFAPPFAVINDFDFLATLPMAAWTDGIAEAFKVAMIKDAGFFDWLCENASALGRRAAAPMEQLIIRCAELHLQHIREGGDPFEMGQARPLDFGHWSAHRLEVLSDYEVTHGAAVAIGLALDALYALRKGWISPAEYERLRVGLSSAGFRLWHDLLDARDAAGKLKILQGLQDFQEHLGGELCITMPRGIGQKFEVHEMDLAVIESCIAELRPLQS
jgi:3-dehydroquinate synthase